MTGDRARLHQVVANLLANARDNAFQRFTRGDDSRNRAAGSTGLGLSIVEAVARSHGGRVVLTSRPGDTTFTVALPAGDAPLVTAAPRPV